jgi:hypothetical protein
MCWAFCTAKNWNEKADETLALLSDILIVNACELQYIVDGIITEIGVL